MRKVNRLQKYNYSTPGYYFITACTDQRQEYFGKIKEGGIILNECGKIAEAIWQRTPKIYKDIELDGYIIMPNHIHAIVIINKQATGLHYNLSKIVGTYKNVVTKNIRQRLNPEFAWQPSFYDHVIRKEEDLEKIREYIRNNPLNWELEKNNTKNLYM